MRPTTELTIWVEEVRNTVSVVMEQKELLDLRAVMRHTKPLVPRSMRRQMVQLIQQSRMMQTEPLAMKSMNRAGVRLEEDKEEAPKTAPPPALWTELGPASLGRLDQTARKARKMETTALAGDPMRPTMT